MRLILVPSNHSQAVQAWKNHESAFVSELLKDEQAATRLHNQFATELTKLVNLLSTAGNMTPEKIYLMTEQFFLHPDTRHLCLHELRFFLQQAFTFKYGKTYHGFGLDVLMDWFNKYFEEREKNIIKDREQEHTNITAHERVERSKGEVFAAGQIIQQQKTA